MNKKELLCHMYIYIYTSLQHAMTLSILFLLIFFLCDDMIFFFYTLLM